MSRRFGESVQRVNRTTDVIETVTVGLTDYQRYPAHRLLRFSGPIEAISVSRGKILARSLSHCGAALINGWETGIAFQQLHPGVPMAVAMDTTPALMRKFAALERQGIARRAASRALGTVYDRLFAKLVRNAVVLLPISEWCRSSLIQDYGAAASSSSVTLTPQGKFPLARVEMPVDAALRLLFVGNDFARKGGELIIELANRLIAESYSFAIVSNDPSLTRLQLPSNVTVISGLRSAAEVAPYYAAADVLLLPTKRDQLPNGIGEAMSAGVVPLCSDVGAISEVVQHEVSGLVMSEGSTADEWTSAVRGLNADRDRLRQFSRAAKDFADGRLSFSEFDQVVLAAINRLTSGQAGR